MKIKENFASNWIAIPQKSLSSEIDTNDHLLVAVVYNHKVTEWFTLSIATTTHWEFYLGGSKVSWDDLPDKLRMDVRLVPCWTGVVKDYWMDLGYRDETYYGLEALEQL